MANDARRLPQLSDAEKQELLQLLEAKAAASLQNLQEIGRQELNRWIRRLKQRDALTEAGQRELAALLAERERRDAAQHELVEASLLRLEELFSPPGWPAEFDVAGYHAAKAAYEAAFHRHRQRLADLYARAPHPDDVPSEERVKRLLEYETNPDPLSAEADRLAAADGCPEPDREDYRLIRPADRVEEPVREAKCDLVEDSPPRHVAEQAQAGVHDTPEPLPAAQPAPRPKVSAPFVPAQSAVDKLGPFRDRDAGLTPAAYEDH